MKSSFVIEGNAQQAQTFSYGYLPFDLPENVIRIDVAYEYNNKIGSDPELTGGNTVDIGIFDPRGIAFMSEGYRGWTGSSRSEFFIALDEATAGYMAGPIQAGQWHIILGFYKVGSMGCHYRVKIDFETAENPQITSFPKRLPLSMEAVSPRASGWYKGDLHCHSCQSDGDSDPLEVVRKAEALGLDFLALTDHNVLSHQVRLAQIETNLMLIPAMEVTTFKGHWNIWGDDGWIDFRLLSEDDMKAAIAEAKSRGYLVSCNHPRPNGPAWAFENVENFDCIEVWNGPWELNNEACLAFWEAKLKQGKIYPALGGSDTHFHKRSHHAKLGEPSTYIYCPEAPSPMALLKALKKGHAFISDSADGPEIVLSSGMAMMGDSVASPENREISIKLECKKAAGLSLEILTAKGIVYQSQAQDDLSLSIPIGTSPYLRAQLREGYSGKVRALTNPIYLTQGDKNDVEES
jgi:hypothetical protein